MTTSRSNTHVLVADVLSPVKSETPPLFSEPSELELAIRAMQEQKAAPAVPAITQPLIFNEPILTPAEERLMKVSLNASHIANNAELKLSFAHSIQSLNYQHQKGNVLKSSEEAWLAFRADLLSEMNSPSGDENDSAVPLPLHRSKF